MVLANPLRLKADIIEKIRTDAELFGKVAKAGDILPESLPRSLRNHASTLTQKQVLMVIAAHLNVSENDLLVTEPQHKTTAS